MAIISPVNPININADGTIIGSLNWHLQAEGFKGAVDFLAPCGSPVFAVWDGVVTHYNPGSGGNHQFIITRADGMVANYVHTSSWPANGATVKAGDLIAQVGQEGQSNGICHLHLTILDKQGHYQPGGGVQVPEKTYIYNLLTGAGLQNVDTSKVVIPTSGENHQISTVHNNQQPTNIVSIVPEKVVFIYNGKVDPNHWQLVFPVHNKNIGGVHSNVEVPQKGMLEKIMFLNHSGNVIAEQEINLELQEGDLLNIDYTYSIQKFADCSELPDLKWDIDASRMLHAMTVHTLDWEDGHQGVTFDNNDYIKVNDGTSNGDAGTTQLNSLFGTSGTTGSVGGTISGNGLTDNEKQTAQALKDLLPTNLNNIDVIAGIMGNVKIESNFDPHIHQVGGPAQGLFQWQGSRLSDLLSHFSVTNINQLNIKQQVEYAILELTRDVIPASGAMPTDTPENVASWWDQHWERSSGTARGQRITWAINYSHMLDVSASTPSTPPTSGHYSGNFIRR